MSFPRVCGDVPGWFNTTVEAIGFSPRMRGCSFRRVFEGVPGGVFPAYAGMFRGRSIRGLRWWGFPRVCGDVPKSL